MPSCLELEESGQTVVSLLDHYSNRLTQALPFAKTHQVEQTALNLQGQPATEKIALGQRKSKCKVMITGSLFYKIPFSFGIK